MSIQYMVPGFEPMTFGTWVSSHNHLTRSPALGGILLCYSTIYIISLSIFDFKWEEWEQITFSLAKLMTIMHIIFHQRWHFA